MSAEDKWQDADRISDKIVDLLRTELATVNPVQVFAGLMLGMLALLRTAPKDMPISLTMVGAAIEHCLEQMWEAQGSSSRSAGRRSRMH